MAAPSRYGRVESHKLVVPLVNRKIELDRSPTDDDVYEARRSHRSMWKVRLRNLRRSHPLALLSRKLAIRTSERTESHLTQRLQEALEK